MARRRYAKHDVTFWFNGKQIAGSTVATSDFLVLVQNMHKGATIQQLYSELQDRTKWLRNEEALAVLEAYIQKGAGNMVPQWK